MRRRLETIFFFAAAGGLAAGLLVGGGWRLVFLPVLAGSLYLIAGPNGRAALAVVVAPLAIFQGALHVVHARWEGLVAADVVGFLELALGFLGLAAAVLALLDRPSAPWKRRAFRWPATVVGAVALVFFVVLPMNVAVWLTAKPRTSVADTDLRIPHESVGLRTSDGVELAAWYVPSRNRAAILLVHGAGGSRDGARSHAELLARNGYGVLLYDARGRGESGGRTDGMGWTWQRDVDAALDYLGSRPDVEPGRVGALGLSTGAEVVLEATARTQRIRAVVADGAIFRSMNELRLHDTTDAKTGWAYWWVVYKTMEALTGSSPPPSLGELVPRIAPRPLLLISGAPGDEQAANEIWAAGAGSGSSIWHAEDAGHTRALAAHPAEYERRVVGLFRRGLLHP
jgi:uncharacterized protein